MEITRFTRATPYDAPGHFDMRCLRLQGHDVSSATFAWVGISHFLPNGGAEMDTGTLDRIYLVLEGEITIELENGDCYQLTRYDSCFIPADTKRRLYNKQNDITTMVVIMPYPEAKNDTP